MKRSAMADVPFGEEWCGRCSPVSWNPTMAQNGTFWSAGGTRVGITPSSSHDRLAVSLMGATEDELDWRENQMRSRENCNRVDRAFLSGTFAITAMWAVLGLLGLGSIGGVTALGYVTYAHFLTGH